MGTPTVRQEHSPAHPKQTSEGDGLSYYFPWPPLAAPPPCPADEAPAEEAADEPELDIAPEDAPTLGAEATAPEYPPPVEPIDGKLRAPPPLPPPKPPKPRLGGTKNTRETVFGLK
jgi:hypothetical protein